MGRLPACWVRRSSSGRIFRKAFKARRIRFPDGIAFAGSQFVFARVFRAAVLQSGVQSSTACCLQGARGGEITAHGLRHSAAMILLNHVGKDLRELLRHKNIRTTVRYTHVGYEQTRETAEALSQALE
jgi:integrase